MVLSILIRRRTIKKYARNDAEAERTNSDNGIKNASISQIFQDYEQKRDAIISNARKYTVASVFSRACKALENLIYMRNARENTPESSEVEQKNDEISRIVHGIDEMNKHLSSLNKGNSVDLSLHEINTKLEALNAELSLRKKELLPLKEKEKEAKIIISKKINLAEKKCRKLLAIYRKRRKGVAFKLDRLAQKYAKELKYYWTEYKKVRKPGVAILTFSQECRNRGINSLKSKDLFPEEEDKLNGLVSSAGLILKK